MLSLRKNFSSSVCALARDFLGSRRRFALALLRIAEQGNGRASSADQRAARPSDRACAARSASQVGALRAMLFHAVATSALQRALRSFNALLIESKRRARARRETRTDSISINGQRAVRRTIAAMS